MLNVLSTPSGLIGMLIALAVIFLILLTVIILRYKKCPSDKIMVIYGKVGGKGASFSCRHGGAYFIMPLLQSYCFLDLTPITLEIDMKDILSRDRLRIGITVRLTVGISTLPDLMNNAAERLTGLTPKAISDLAADIFRGQIRLAVQAGEAEAMQSDTDKLLETVAVKANEALGKIGLWLINADINGVVIS